MNALTDTLQASEGSRRWGITLVRLITGFAFFMHGFQKVFEMGVGTVQEGFAQMGIPMAQLTAPLVAYLELFGGAALIFGLFTRWISIPLAINMLGAMAFVHWPSGFFAPQGIELPLMFFAALGTLVLGGPGAIALDNLLARPRLTRDFGMAHARSVAEADAAELERRRRAA
jgi:putative oxidoreductase